MRARDRRAESGWSGARVSDVRVRDLSWPLGSGVRKAVKG